MKQNKLKQKKQKEHICLLDVKQKKQNSKRNETKKFIYEKKQKE